MRVNVMLYIDDEPKLIQELKDKENKLNEREWEIREIRRRIKVLEQDKEAFNTSPHWLLEDERRRWHSHHRLCSQPPHEDGC